MLCHKFVDTTKKTEIIHVSEFSSDILDGNLSKFIEKEINEMYSKSDLWSVFYEFVNYFKIRILIIIKEIISSKF
jgi:hypothetical protein